MSAVLDEFPEVKKFPGNRIDPPAPWSRFPGGSRSVTLGVGHPRLVDRRRLRRFLGSLRPGVFITGHVPHSPELAEDLDELGFRVIAMVRDPRDVVVSKVRFANSLPDGRADREVLKSRSHEEQIDLAIDGYRLGDAPPVDIGERLGSIVGWQAAGALIVRFEDLVGERGGGDPERQLATIRAIRTHVGLEDVEGLAEQAAAESYGRSPTFRAGRSRGWQEQLSSEQAARIERLAGPFMQELGYPASSPASSD